MDGVFHTGWTVAEGLATLGFGQEAANGSMCRPIGRRVAGNGKRPGGGKGTEGRASGQKAKGGGSVGFLGLREKSSPSSYTVTLALLPLRSHHSPNPFFFSPPTLCQPIVRSSAVAAVANAKSPWRAPGHQADEAEAVEEVEANKKANLDLGSVNSMAKTQITVQGDVP
nr:unnamed protein product [Digitaria exilis]